MKSPKFTDSHKFQRPYSPAAETEKAGYLAAKFTRIRRELREKEQRELQRVEVANAEAQAKVRKMERAK